MPTMGMQIMQHPFAEFELSRRASRQAYRTLQRIGLVSIAFTGFVTCIWPTRNRAALILILGITTGIYLVIKGSRDLFFTDHPRSWLGEKLAHSSDRWFPKLAFLAQHAYLSLAAVSIWLSMVQLGFEAEPRDHLGFVGLACLIPLKRFAGAVLHQNPSRFRLVIDEAVRILLAFVVILTAARIFLFLCVPGDVRYLRTPPHSVVAMWVAVVLAMLAQLIASLNRVTQKDPF